MTGQVKSITNKQTWIAFTDGASRGNPGLAGCGVFLVSPTGQEFSHKKFMGTKTNNQAEYAALIIALRGLIRAGAKRALIKADSEFMIKQLTGQYKVKNESIRRLFNEVQRLVKEFSHISFKHVPREQNKIADRLANQAIDEACLLT